MRAATFVSQRGATMARSTATLHRFSALRMMSSAAPASKVRYFSCGLLQ
jgi:hypothetical protein